MDLALLRPPSPTAPSSSTPSARLLLSHRPSSCSPWKLSSRPAQQWRKLAISDNVYKSTVSSAQETQLYRKEIRLQGESEVMGPPFPAVGSLEAVLFDIDGTLCDSDPLHYLSFVEMLQEVGFQGGEPISEEFFIDNITGTDNLELSVKLFPEWEQDKRDKFMHDKEDRFRSLAAKMLKPVEGLETLCQWIEERGLKRAAVTNAPRENAELMISILGLTNFFEILVVGSECERAKPFPDPYLKALKHFGLSSDRAFVFEDSSTGLTAAVAAGMAVIGVGFRNPEDSLLKAGATCVISDFKDPQLWNLLEGQPQNSV